MKKYASLILIAVTAIAALLIVLFANRRTTALPELQPRTGPIAMSAEWRNTQAVISDLLRYIETHPEDVDSKIKLAQAFIQESRITGNHAYYDKAVLQIVDDILSGQPGHFEALCCKALVLLSQHHFEDALAVAGKARAVNPTSAFVYGLLCDASVELGDYKMAVQYCDQMVSIRPDNRSYSRISYLREIHGDLPGAQHAAELAVSAGYPGLEQTAWSRVILAKLYLQRNLADSAMVSCEQALAERPGYPWALELMGDIHLIKNQPHKALEYYERAQQNMASQSFKGKMAAAIYYRGDQDKFRRLTDEEIQTLLDSDGDESDKGHGHYADLELADLYLQMGEVNKASQHAETEYQRRPENIEVCSQLGWIRYKQGKFPEAVKLTGQALRTGSKDPRIIARSALINYRVSKKTGSADILKQLNSSNQLAGDVALKNEINKVLGDVRI